MNWLTKILILISLFLISVNLSAQNDTTNFLALYKSKIKNNRVIFPTGLKYQFKVKDNKENVEGTLIKTKDSLVYLNSDTLNISYIEKVYTPFYRNGIVFFKHLFAKGGVGLMVIGPFNNLINKEKPIMGTLGITGASLFVSSRLLKLLETKSYSVRKRTKLKAVYFY